MNLMRKLRDQGKFKNSMLAEIEEDERVQVFLTRRVKFNYPPLTMQALQDELKKTEKLVDKIQDQIQDLSEVGHVVAYLSNR